VKSVLCEKVKGTNLKVFIVEAVENTSKLLLTVANLK